MSIAVRPETNHSALDIQPSQDQAITRLAEWARVADTAYQMATKLCGTQFVPKQYYNKPEEATAAILAGAEVGLAPMAALRAFDPIQGTPAPKAITLRAIVQSLGHDIRMDESTDTVGVVSARRKGSNDWQTSTWTIERAQQAGYPAKNPNWKTAPAAMLIARATAEVCRWVASDAIMGMPYSAEEIRDEGAAYEPKPAAQRVTAAEILGQVDTPIPPAPQQEPEPDGDPQPVQMVRDDQRRRMFKLWADLGYGTEEQRSNRLTITAKILGLTEPLESSNDLTEADADVVIAALNNRLAAQSEPQGGEQA